MEDLEKKLQADFDAGIKNLADQITKNNDFAKESIEKVANETKSSVDEVKQKLEEFGIQLKEIKSGNGFKIKSIDDILTEQKQAITDSIKQRKSHIFDVSRKSLVSGASLDGGTIALNLPDIGQQAIRSTVIASSLFQEVMPMGNAGTVSYMDQETITRGAAMRAEGAIRGESAIAWKRYTEETKNIGDWIPVTEESLMDLNFIRSEINNLLANNMRLIEDSQAWNGSGTGDDIKGIYTYATAFNIGTYAGVKFDNPSLLELISVLQNQISVGKESKYMPNKIYLNPADLQELRFKKDNDGAYLNPVWAYNGMTLPGLVESSIVSQGTMLVGDMNWVRYFNTLNYTIETGWINDDFVKGKVAIRASKRAFNLVRNVDLSCLLKVTSITDALNAIKKP